jgi:hypothetical protein
MDKVQETTFTDYKFTLLAKLTQTVLIKFSVL